MMRSVAQSSSCRGFSARADLARLMASNLDTAYVISVPTVTAWYREDSKENRVS